MKRVITIGREFGSGGREVGQKLAQSLGIPFYDKELITIAAQKSGISPGQLEILEEKNQGVLEEFARGAYASVGYWSGMETVKDELFRIQSETIRMLADQGPCVIIGRCADYVLQEKHCVSVFVHAPMEQRIARIRERHPGQQNAEDLIRKTDKQRANYYNYYTDRKWGRVDNYHLSLSSVIGIEQTARVIQAYAENF